MADNETTTQEPTPAPVTPPAPQPPSEPKSTPAPGLDPRVYNPEGKLWRDMFHGLTGSLQQQRDQAAKDLGTVRAQLDTASQQLTERDATIASLQATVETLQGQAGQYEEQLQQIPQLQQQAGLAEKYSVLMQFPELLQFQVEQEIPPPDGEGESTKIVVNPYLQMVATSGLDGEGLRQTLANIVAALPKADPQQPGTPATLSAPTIPSPAQPVQDELAVLKERQKDLQLRIKRGEVSLRDEFAEVNLKIRKLEAAKA